MARRQPKLTAEALFTAADVTIADRWAAQILLEFLAHFMAHRGSEKTVTTHPLYAEIRRCDEQQAAALLVAAIAYKHHPMWRSAIGLITPGLLYVGDPFHELQKNLLRREFGHSEVHQGILLQCVIARHSSILGHFEAIPGLLARLMAWADRHKGKHVSLWEGLLPYARDERGDRVPKLVKYTGIVLPPMLPPLDACARALLLHPKARKPVREYAHLPDHVVIMSNNHGFDIREDNYYGGILGWSARSGAISFTFDSMPSLDIIDPETHEAPSRAEFDALAKLMRDVPASPIAAELTNIVACLARQLKVPAEADAFADLQVVADRCKPWETNRVVASKRAMSRAEAAFEATDSDAGRAVFAHLDTATGKPSAKWLKELSSRVQPKQRAVLTELVATFLHEGWASRRYPDPEENRLKGLVWASVLCDPAKVAGPLARFALSVCFEKIAGLGMRDEGLGNACLNSLAALPDGAGVPHLARLLAKVKYPKTKKLIETALNDAAAKAGMTRGALDEVSVPTHDLDQDGRAEISVGPGAARLTIDGTAAVALTWRAVDGKITKSLPAALKPFKDEIKAVKTRLKEIEDDLGVQPWRVQRLWLEERRWLPEAWRQRYADHPLMGALSRRLIWNVHMGAQRTAGIWTSGGLADLDGRALPLDGAELSLWHPVGCEVAEVLAWRERIAALGIVQPFKQAHREVYIVTDAEQRTGVYSNRFAGHIIKQHQMQALARLNGWAMTTHMGYDGGMGKYPSRIALPEAGLIAEYWLEGTGGDNDYTPSGARLYLSTDQLRFLRPSDMASATKALGRNYGDIAGDVLRIEDVPPRLLSEIMRHCDLFVGVASIANDPNWIDAGSDVARGHWREGANTYWHDRSFGDIGAAGETRRTLLMAMLSSLAIGKVARIDGKFLRVEGKRRTYKIHLGSGNILMEPNDQYLCIVPKSSVETVRLPFEGDVVMSIILSKAVMLAADDKITDSTIVSQIGR